MYVSNPMKAQFNVKWMVFTWVFSHVGLFPDLCACKQGLETGWLEAGEYNIRLADQPVYRAIYEQDFHITFRNGS